MKLLFTKKGNQPKSRLVKVIMSLSIAMGVVLFLASQMDNESLLALSGLVSGALSYLFIV